MKNVVILFLFFVVISCKEQTEKNEQVIANKELTAQDIIDKAIEKSCNGNCNQAEITFTFRENSYRSKRLKGAFELERVAKDSIGVVRDQLTNEGFTRSVNDVELKIADTTAKKLSNSVNSVHYFVQLPYGLNDAAVQKKLVGTDTIKDISYYEIEVTFKEEGGGTDYDDVFVYWINKERFTVDYLAYKYEVNGGGIRFREAYNPRTIEGIRFVDYNNYKTDNLQIPLTQLDDLFEKNELALLSKIKTENVSVKLLN